MERGSGRPTFDIWELYLDIWFLFNSLFMLLNLSFRRIIHWNLFHQEIYWFSKNVKTSFQLKGSLDPIILHFLKKFNICTNNMKKKNIVEGEWIQKPFDQSFLLEYIINFTVRYFPILELLVALMCLIKSTTVLFFFSEML